MTTKPYYVPLGPFILDNFEFEDGDNKERTKKDVIGGATYALLGARIWLPPKDVGMLVYRGYDFPGDVQDTLSKYGSSCFVYLDLPLKQTIRGLNKYKGEHRQFEYLTPKRSINPSDIKQTRLNHAQWLHLFSPPSRTYSILEQLSVHDDKDNTNDNKWTPKIVWEPFPSDLGLDYWQSIKPLLSKIDIFSPNLDEAALLLNSQYSHTRNDANDDASLVEFAQKLSNSFIQAGVKCVVIRCGSKGAFVQDARYMSKGVLVCAYHQDNKNVVDVTGGGNAFIAGMVSGLKLCNDDLVEAAYYGSVSASYTIEQYGPPEIIIDDQTGIEYWNTKSEQGLPQARLEYLKNNLWEN